MEKKARKVPGENEKPTNKTVCNYARTARAARNVPVIALEMSEYFMNIITLGNALNRT